MLLWGWTRRPLRTVTHRYTPWRDMRMLRGGDGPRTSRGGAVGMDDADTTTPDRRADESPISVCVACGET